MESFHGADGDKIGVLLRHLAPTSLATMVCFGNKAEPYWVQSRIEFDHADPRTWTHYFHQVGDKLFEQERPDGLPRDTIPGYAEYLVALKLAEEAEGGMDVHIYQEDSGKLSEARFIRAPHRVGIQMGDSIRQHWIYDDQIVASEWGEGATSHRMRNTEELMLGLDENVKRAASQFLSAQD